MSKRGWKSPAVEALKHALESGYENSPVGSGDIGRDGARRPRAAGADNELAIEVFGHEYAPAKGGRALL